jgi:hypothetical protein
MNIDLMAPRYKVIAKWPRGSFRVGLVFTGNILTDLCKSVIECDQYPHLFQKLEWWQERKPEEMPEYLRVVTMINHKNNIGLIFKAVPGGYNEYMPSGFTTTPDGFVSGFDNVLIKCFEPATKEEYDQYIKTVKP